MRVIGRALIGVVLTVIALGIGVSLGACASEAKETRVDSDHLTWGADVDQAMNAFESES